MKRLLLFALISSPVFGQAIIEDWKCGTATVVASPPGGPTTVTCSGPHGFANGQHILLTGATGKWAPINTQWEVLLKYTMSSTGTTVYVNDTSQMDSTPGGLWTIYPETSYPQCGGGVESVSMVSITDNRSVVVQRSSTPHPHCNEDKMFGPTNRQNTWAITTSGPASKTFTIPLDSSAFGSFAGQNISIVRGFSYPYEPTSYYASNSADGSPIALSMTPNGYQQFTIDGCPDKTDAIRCSLGFGDPVNQKGYMDFQTVTSLVVSGGVGTINLAAPFAQTTITNQTRKFQPNELFWLWSMTEPDASFGTINRPWIISSISNGNRTITVNGMGDAGVADGTYTPNTGTIKNFIFPILADFYTYLGSPGDVSLYGYPGGFVQSTLKPSGVRFSPTMNRYRAWMQWGATMTGVPMEWGTYVWEQPSGTSYHGYHTVDLDTVPNEWEQEEFAMVPEHLVGSGPGVPQGGDPTFSGWAGYAPWTGESTHYMDALGTFYMNLSGIYSLIGAQTGLVGPLYMDTASAEPDEWTPIRATRYNPATSAYHLNVVAPVSPVAPVAANFYYSTKGDIRNIGIGAATPAGSAIAGPTSNTNQWNYDSPAMPRQTQIWFAVRPIMPISGVSGNGQSPVVLSFDYAPNMAVNDHVSIAGVQGNTGANCTNCQIVQVYPRQLWFHMAPSPKPPSSQGPLTSIVSNGSVCTANLAGPSGLTPGWRIGVTGVPTGGPGNITGYGAAGVTWFNVSSVSGNSFTFPCPGTIAGTYNTDANSGGGVFMGIIADPAVAIAGTGSGDWNGTFTGTMVSTENNRNFAEINFQPPAAAGIPLVNSLQCNPGVIAPGGTSTCTVAINQAEPRMPVYIKNSNSAALKAPQTVMVTGLSGKFNVTAASGFTGSVTLRAHYNGEGQNFVLFIGSAAQTKKGVHKTVAGTGAQNVSVNRPAGPAVVSQGPKLISLTCIPKAALPGDSMRCEAGLDSAPAGNLSARLSSSNTGLLTPQTITFRAHQSALAFYTQVSAGAKQPAATLQAALGDSVVEEHLLLLPSTAPALAVPGAQFVRPGETLGFTLHTSADESAPVRVSAGSLPRGAGFQTDGLSFTWTPDKSQTGTYEVSFTATSAAQVSRTGKVRIEVSSGRPVATEIHNAANYAAPAACSPGGLASISGKWLLNNDATTHVTIDGEPAKVVSASPTRIDFVCPSQALGNPSVTVETAQGATEPLRLTMQDAGPAIFSLDGSGRGQGQILAGGTASLVTARTFSSTGTPAQAGDVVRLRITGVPKTSAVRVLIGGLDAETTGTLPVPGLDNISELQVKVPDGIPAGDDVPVRLETLSGGKIVQSNTVTMAVEASR